MRLRDLHPNLYSMFRDYAWISIAVGINFIFFTPAFNPFDIPKNPSGGVFLITGVCQLAVLHWGQNLRLVRIAMAVTVGVMIFWGGILGLAAALAHQTSYQLPIFILGLAWVGRRWLPEPFVNPVTMNGKSEGTP